MRINKSPQVRRRLRAHLKMKYLQKHSNVSCMACGRPFNGKLPRMCCDGYMCGCMGMPTEPVVCDEKCYDALMAGKSVAYFYENFCLVNGEKPKLTEHDRQWLAELQAKTDAGYVLELFKGRKGNKWLWVKKKDPVEDILAMQQFAQKKAHEITGIPKKYFK